MRLGLHRAAPLTAAVALTIAIVAPGASAQSPGASPGAAPATPTVGAPGTITLKDGSTFTLAPRIADKITNKEPLNVYLSYQVLSQTGGPAMLSAGLAQAAKEMGDKYGVTINATLVGPPNTDPPAQISQVQQLVDSGQADCVGIEPVTPDAFQKVIDTTIGAGVPVMTVNTDSPESKRLAYFGANDTDPTNPLFTGTTAGQFTVDWAQKNGIDIKDAALITGDTTAPWAQGRMQGWLDTVQAAFPNMKVEGTPTNAFTTGYLPNEITPKMEAYMTGHPDVDFYFSSDWEARDIGQLIDKMGLKDKVHALGFNVDQTMLDDLDKGLIIGTIDQRYDLQAKTFLEGCADLLLGGIVPGEWQYVTPTVWTPDTAADARALYESLNGL
jgi:ribose transport system substrate-binding protein